MNKEFCQQLCKIEINFLGGINDIKLKLDSGKSEYDEEKINIMPNLTNQKVLMELLNKNILYTEDLFLIKNKLRELYDYSSKHGLELNGYIHYVSDFIEIQNKNDYRNYGYIKIFLNHKEKNKVIFKDKQIVENNINDLIKSIDKLYCDLFNEINILVNLKNNIQFLTTDVLFSNEAAAYVIHEVLGHTLECDNFYSMNMFNDLKINNKLINLKEDNSEKENKFVNKIDCKGNIIEPSTLVENGEIKNLIGKNISLNTNINASYICESYKYKPIPRMINTNMLPKDKDAKNYLLKSIEDGIYVKRISNGYLNTMTGDILLNCVMGNFIKNGHKCEYIGNFIVQSTYKEILKNLISVGNDYKKFFGLCTKNNQTIPVIMGSPSMLVSNIRVLGRG